MKEKAQKKPQAEPKAVDSKAARMAVRLNKKFGAGTFVTFDQASSNIKRWLDTGNPIINLLMSGNTRLGIPAGRMYEFYGEEQVGKSTMGCLIAASVQHKYDGLVAIIDTESAMTKGRAVTLGIKEKSMLYCEEVYVEDILTQLDAFIALAGSTPCVIFWDTVAASRSRINANRDIGRGRRADIAAPMSEGLARIAKPLAKSNTILIACNQLRHGDIDGNPYRTKREEESTKGGKALKFHAESRLRFKYISDAYRAVKGKKELQGFIVDIAVTKNKNAPNDMSARLYFQTRGPNSGKFNMALSCLMTGVRWGCIKKSQTTGRFSFDGVQYATAKWEKEYDTNQVFHAKVEHMLQTAYARITDTAQGAAKQEEEEE